MNKKEILETIKNLAKGQGFYSRIYKQLTEDLERGESFLKFLEEQNFTDTIDLIMFLEE